jgi:cytochrome o ubiquinol oxidase subunit III
VARGGAGPVSVAAVAAGTPGGHAAAGASGGHEDLKRLVVAYGFWIFLISDIIMFAAFFATYAVLTDSTAGGPAGRDLFQIRTVAIETGCLLLSSFSCGLAMIGARFRSNRVFHAAMAVTLALGATFLWLEVHEFARMVAEGAGPTRSGFLSAFFALIGCHGIHVTA